MSFVDKFPNPNFFTDKFLSLSFVNLSFRLGIAASIIFVLTVSAFAQKRDNLTDAEDMLVREAQEIDLRMEVFTKVIDRRFLALTNADAAQSKQAQKDSEKWGELRTGTSAELFSDVQKTLDEAIRKIDDVAERDQKNPLFPKAVNILAKACGRFIPQLTAFQQKTAETSERVFISNSIEACKQVIEASVKVPKEIPKNSKKKN